MPDDVSPAGAAEPEQASCEKCGGLLEELTRLPKRFDHPTFDVFRCMACGVVNWIERPDE